jgi:hypothetical protein
LTWLIGRQQWLKKDAVRRQRRTKIDETLVDLANRKIKRVKKKAVKIHNKKNKRIETFVDLAYW